MFENINVEPPMEMLSIPVLPVRLERIRYEAVKESRLKARSNADPRVLAQQAVKLRLDRRPWEPLVG
jgi:hypothetical protein